MKTGLLKVWLPPAVWAAVIFITSCYFINTKQFVHSVVQAPVVKLTTSQFNDFWNQRWWLFVKGYHVLEFFILDLLTCSAMKRNFGWRASSAVALSALASFLYACSDEWHQTFVPGRGGKVSDVAIDTIGIVLATLLLTLAAKKHGKT